MITHFIWQFPDPPLLPSHISSPFCLPPPPHTHQISSWLRCWVVMFMALMLLQWKCAVESYMDEMEQVETDATKTKMYLKKEARARI